MNWNDISVEQFIEIKNLKLEDFNSHFEYYKELISICYQKSNDEIDEMDIDEFDDLKNKISFLFTDIPEKNKDIVLINNISFHFINNLNKITLAEWLDLEYYLLNDFNNNFTKILAILFRIKEEKNSILFPDKFEEYESFSSHRANLFLNIKLTDVYGVVKKYITWRENLLQQYHGLFKNQDETDNAKDLTEKEIEILTESDQKQLKSDIEKEKKIAKWNIEVFLKNITGNDITKVEQIIKLNLIFILNWKSADIEVGNQN